MMGKLIFVCLFSSVVIFGCGGGGGGDAGGDSAPTPAPAIQVLPPQSNVAPGNYSDSRRAEAYQRVNYYRGLMGLGLFRQNERLDVAAQAHVQYVIENDLEHFESIGKIGYTGRSPRDRASFSGYNSSVIGEVANAHIGSPTSAIDVFMDSLYHRIAFIQYNFVDIGIGVGTSKYAESNSNTFFTVLNVGIPANSFGQEAPSVPYVVWPVRNAIIEKGSISPGEIPAPPGAGYPITISFDPRKIVATKRFELRESGSSLIESYVLTATSDPNKLIPPFIVALMPRDALKPSTGFTALWEGTVDGAPLTLTWGFSTK